MQDKRGSETGENLGVEEDDDDDDEDYEEKEEEESTKFLLMNRFSLKSKHRMLIKTCLEMVHGILNALVHFLFVMEIRFQERKLPHKNLLMCFLSVTGGQ